MYTLNNKDLIISTAYEMFKEYGYEAVSIHAIRKECGLSNGTFYHYFKSKEDLLISICLQKIHIYDLTENMEEKAADPEKYLSLYFLSWAEYWKSLGINIVSQIYRIYNLAFIDPDSGELHTMKKIWQTHHLVEYIQKAQEAGTFQKDFTAEEYSHYLFMLTRGILYEWTLQVSKTDLIDLGARYLPLILKQLIVE